MLLPVLWYHCTAIALAAKPMCVPILCPPEGRKVWSLWQVGFMLPHLSIGLLSNIHIFTALNVGLPIAVGPMQQMGPAPTTDFFIPRYKNKTPYYNMFLGTWNLIEFCVHYNDDIRYWTTQNTVSQGMFPWNLKYNINLIWSLRKYFVLCIRLPESPLPSMRNLPRF